MEHEARHLLNADSYEDFSIRFEAWLKQVFEQLQSLRRKSAEELFRQIDQYTRGNLYSQLSITDVARKFHVSPSYVSRIMKRYAESSFVQYYTRLKITEACRLMADRSDMKVKEISDALSFSDQHYFSKVFKEYTGLCPTDYREKQV
nr:helix-turn-helix domain-containing protein [Paenibacillus brevis]